MANINGTNGNDTLTGTGGNDTLSGGNGNDTLYGGNGSDTLAGGNGSDILDGGDGNDVMDGGNDSDTLTGGSGNDTMTGGNGSDFLDGGDNNDVLDGGNGDDTVLGGGGNDTLRGDNGSDILDGGAGSDNLTAGNGSDIAIYVKSENAGQHDVYDGENGNDTLRLVLTLAERNSAAVQADIAAYQYFLAHHPGSATFHFSSFDLSARNFERLEIVIAEDDSATITQFANGDLIFDIFNPAFFAPDFEFNVATFGPTTSTSFTLRNETETNFSIVVTGTGFTYGNGPAGPQSPVTGTIQTLTIMDGSTVLAVIDGLSENAPALLAAIEDIPSDDSAFNAILDQYRITYDASAVDQGFAAGATFGNDDTFIGGDGDNAFRGFDGVDTYSGGAGDDALDYGLEDGGTGVNVNLGTGTGTDTYGNLETFTGMEKIWASKYNDILIGSDGNNLFEGHEGNDSIDGRGENDTIWYRSEVWYGGVGGIDANLTTGIVIDSFGDTDTVTNIESVAGTDSNDIMVGNGADNDFQGFDGADTFNGMGGSDAVSFSDENGGSGAVVNLTTGLGTDTYGNAETFTSIERLHGSIYNDTFTGSNANELFEGRRGNDVINGGGGNDVIFYYAEQFMGGTQGIDANLTTGIVVDSFGNTDTVSNVESVVGTDFNDTFVGNASDNDFNGRGGADTYAGGAGSDAVSFEEEFGGNGVVVNLVTGTGTDTFGNAETFSSIERLHGSAFNDTFTGSNANELFEGRRGDDVIDGGGGFDVIWYLSEANLGGGGGINANLSTGVVIDGFGNTDLVSNIENVEGTNQNDVFMGNFDNNAFAGFGGADTYNGGSGGDDAINYTHDGGGLGVVIDLASGTATDTFGNAETFSNIDKVWGSQNSDNMTGDGNNNLFEGHGGNDVIDGAGGDDVVWYRSEVHSGGTTGVIVNLATGIGVDSLGGIDTLSNIENVSGTDFADVLIGNTSNNTFEGYNGADSFSGDLGFDSVNYAGEDGGLGVVADLSSGTGTDTWGSTDTYAGIENLAGSEWNDTLTGDATGNFIMGGGGGDTLSGGGSGDTLDGGNDNDRIAGGADGDILFGGGGDDTFIFQSASEGGDFISDYEAGGDRLEISASGFGGGLAAGALAANYLVVGLGPVAATEGGHGQFLFETNTGNLYWDVDGTGALGADFITVLNNTPSITTSDFILV